jgi:hypothetical protein
MANVADGEIHLVELRRRVGLLTAMLAQRDREPSVSL